MRSVTAAARAGIDMYMPGGTAVAAQLTKAVRDGKVSAAALDDMVSRVLTEMFRFGMFNRRQTGSPSSRVTTAAHQAVSQQVAEDGTVLLRNSGGILPLPSRGAGTIAVIGPAASAAPVYAGGGSASVIPPFTTTPLDGLQSAAGSGTQVVYAQGLPTDSGLTAIPASVLSPGYPPAGTKAGYTGTLRAPQTGTYVIGLARSCHCSSVTYLSMDGHKLLANPASSGSAYSVAVALTAGQRYTLTVTGTSSALTWATPSDLAAYIDPAVAVAKSARTAVVVVADNTESEGADRQSLDLPSAQNELIAAVAAANPRTVVVIDAGAPVVMPWLSDVAAVVDAWYPGESNGTALAAVLYGRADPSGHLPVTFPVSLTQVPAASPARFPGEHGTVSYSEGLLVGYRWYDERNITPLFPFGFGLSYTRFAYSRLRVSPARVTNPGSGPGPAGCRCNRQGQVLFRVAVTVTNTGRVAGADVVQLYVGDPSSAGEPPRQLKGFQRVSLAPGRSVTVHFLLTGHDLSYWDSARDGWVVPSGAFHLYAGDSSALANLPARATATVTRKQAR